MANPITTIINPDQTRILRYWVTAKQQLALAQAPLVDGEQAIKYRANGTPQGNHATNQYISAVYMRGIPTVYGKLFKDKQLVLAQLSPITNILAEADDQEDTTTSLQGFAAASNNANKAWLFFLRKPSAESPAALSLTTIEYEDVKTKAVGDLTESQQPAEDSKLAAIFVDGEVQVFYQQHAEDDNKLYWFALGAHNGPQAIDGTALALSGTPIAVTRAKSNGTLYLYYMASNGEVQRATKAQGGKWQATSASINMGPVKKMQKESQISVTHSDIGGKLENQVYFIEKGDTEYSIHHDVL